MEEKHNHGIDIIRIMGMMGIIGLHVINAGGILANSKFINYYIVDLFNIIFMSSVNLFAIISGYLYIGKKVNYNSIINLIITTLFYSVVITSIAFFLFPEIFSNLKILISGLFPPVIDRYWYLVSYVFLFFCIPYINIFIKNIDKTILEKLIFIIFILFCIISIFGYVDYFRINEGYSPFWLMYCYIIGAYLKLYDLPYSLKKNKMIIWYFINIIIVFLFGFVTNKIELTNMFIRYNSPFILFNSVLFFICFINLKIKNMFIRMVLENLSSVSFEVYIIHGHYIILDYLITNNFIFTLKYSPIIITIMLPCIIIIIYLVCGIISKVKQYIFSTIKINKLFSPLGDVLNKNLVK